MQLMDNTGADTAPNNGNNNQPISEEKSRMGGIRKQPPQIISNNTSTVNNQVVQPDNNPDRKKGIAQFRRGAAQLMASADQADAEAEERAKSMSFKDKEALYFNDLDPVDDIQEESKALSFFNKILRGLQRLAYRIPIVDFITDVIGYLMKRSRVIFVLSTVLAAVLAKQFEGVKKFFVRKMFWGRGNFFKFSVQLVLAFVVVIGATFVLGGYRNRLTEAESNEVLAARSTGYAEDLYVQNASTKTVASDITARYDQRTYVVKGGDTMSGIAELFDISVDAILWANDMSQYDVLKPGMELTIPPQEGLFIKVARGDTIDSLSEEYNANPQNIVTFNKLVYPYELEVGQQIFLPGGSKEDEVAPVQQAPIFTGIVTSRSSGSTGTVTTVDPSVGRFLAWPVSGGGRLTQCYSGYHNGVDIADRSSPTLVAAAPGVVTLAGCQSGSCPTGEVGGSGLAWTVIIDHGNGYSTVYGHMSTGDIYVKNGQAVARGQAIGRMGQSGTAYGIHVHFMLIRSGTWSWVNPSPYMSTNICGY